MPTESPANVLFEYVLASSAKEPAAKRIELYRALSRVIGCEKTSAQLITLAVDLEAIDFRQQQLLLDFQRRNGGQV